MSSQINDIFQYENNDYYISAIEHEDNFFNISDLGLNTRPGSTACWRGYMGIFGLNKDKRLILIELYATVCENETPPKINGVSPDIIEMRPRDPDFFSRLPEYVLIVGNVQYSFVNLPIPYSGKIVITQDLVEERYFHMGFQPPSSYEKVLELSFLEGQCVEVKDVSKKAGQKRSEAGGKSWEAAYDEDWIEKSFDLGYDDRWD